LRGVFPVLRLLPVLLCAMRAALPLAIPVRRRASYIRWTFVPLGMAHSFDRITQSISTISPSK
jgi:hypothetical protein